MSFTTLMPGRGPASFPTGTLIIPTGTTAALLVAGGPATLFQIINAANAISVGISVYNAATTGAAAATNRIQNAVPLNPGQILTFNAYMSAGIVLTFASATTDNFTITWTALSSV